MKDSQRWVVKSLSLCRKVWQGWKVSHEVMKDSECLSTGVLMAHQLSQGTVRDRPHGNTFVRKCMFCIVLADRPHASCKHRACKRTFLKPSLWVEKFENADLAFSCGQRILILCVSMTPSPHPSTSSLQPLNPETPHDNNNGGLHACVHAAEDIEPIRVTRAKYYAPLPLRWAKKDYGQPTSHFHLLLVVFGFSFYCLFLYSAQALCKCSISSSPFLVNFKCYL